VHGQIAQIAGDFTDWVPHNMHLPAVRETDKSPSKAGVFFFICNVIKGFRYRYTLVWNDQACVDKDARHGPNAIGKETNFIEVAGPTTSAIIDFVNDFNPEIDKPDVGSSSSHPEMSRIKSNFKSVLVSPDLLKKTGVAFAKMNEITEFDDLDLIGKMKRH
jgi:hypothetical protein